VRRPRTGQAAEIAKALGRSLSAIRTRRQELSLTRAAGRPWSDEELETLRAAAVADPPIVDSEVARKLRRARSEVARKRRELGFIRGAVRKWTAEEEEAIRAADAARPQLPLTELAEQLGRSLEGVCRKRDRMGLPRRRRHKTRRKLTRADVEKVGELWDKGRTDRDIAIYFALEGVVVTRSQVLGARRRNGWTMARSPKLLSEYTTEHLRKALRERGYRSARERRAGAAVGLVSEPDGELARCDGCGVVENPVRMNMLVG
jgi:hypothetical protein